mgnify:CR=1 FL=1
MNIFAHLSVTAYYGMPSLGSAQYYVWLVLKALYTINRHSYLSEFFFVCLQTLGCRHDTEVDSQLIYISFNL